LASMLFEQLADCRAWPANPQPLLPYP
jgi:hypothetical protein